MPIPAHHLRPALPGRPAPRAALPVLLAALLALTAAGCEKGRHIEPGAATEPVQTVALLSRHLRDNDLQAFARDAVPPPLRPQLAAAWRAGHTRWPLEELPFDQKIPGVLATLSADKADVQLRQSFDRQFANAHSEIRAAASALGMFGVKFLQGDDSLSAEERTHYAQLVTAMSGWGASAKLGDAKRGRGAIARLTLAARQTGLHGEADFQRYGMDDSLRRMTPLIAALKDTLRSYDLDLDRSLDAMTLSLEHQEGDRARVRMRYPLADTTIDTVVALERVDGHWYLSDFLRHARAAAALAPVAPPVATPSTPAIAPPVVAPAEGADDAPSDALPAPPPRAPAGQNATKQSPSS